MSRDIMLPDAKATETLGASLAGVLTPGDVVALHGGLGAGKTTLVRGLIRALLGDDVDVPSPTYTLVQTYDAPDFMIWHFDLYRLDAPEEVFELGWDETAAGVMLVEWPDRAGPLLPHWRLDLALQHSGDKRQATLEPRGEHWQTRIHGIRIQHSG